MGSTGVVTPVLPCVATGRFGTEEARNGLPLSYDQHVDACKVCEADRTFLQTAERPDYGSLPSPVHVVDLFCGGGGLSLGVVEAAPARGRGAKVLLAVENDDEAADVYAMNFPTARLVRSDVCALFDGELGRPLTAGERKLRRQIGSVDVLVAGPPCQGHSNLNNHTRGADPRNALYLRAVRAAEVLRPSFVLVENVPAIKNDKANVIRSATTVLEHTGYAVASFWSSISSGSGCRSVGSGTSSWRREMAQSSPRSSSTRRRLAPSTTPVRSAGRSRT